MSIVEFMADASQIFPLPGTMPLTRDCEEIGTSRGSRGNPPNPPCLEALNLLAQAPSTVKELVNEVQLTVANSRDLL
jgi:hypothetical protein